MKKPSRGLTGERLKAMKKTRELLLARNFTRQFSPSKTLEAELAFAGITHWEELTCVGFNPERSQLEAVVQIKRSSGYSGGLCTDGSTEYVRFFVDWNDGAGFNDVGLTSFKAFDISNAPAGPQHPLSHMVFLPLDDDDHRFWCPNPVLPTVRAVLGWNEVPSLDPNDVPHYGNAVDADIQLEPRFWTIAGLIDVGLIDISMIEVKLALEGLEIEKELPKPKPKPVPWSALKQQYVKAKVPDHRLVYEAVYPLVNAEAVAPLAAYQPDLAAIKDLNIDIDKVVDTLSSKKANTSYEEVVCAGLNTAADTLGAVIHVRKPSGYSGTLCQNGSKEYVAFWADWNNNGTFDEYLGTADVEVHDISKIPTGGLFYSVLMPVNLASRTKECTQPNIVRIRAVLSWAVLPSTTNPNALNYWGNRIDTLVRVRHSTVPAGTDLMDLLYFVGNVPVENIDPTTHLANPSSGLLNPDNCSRPALDRPFAKAVSIKGRIYNTGPAGTVHYQVQYRPHSSGSWATVTNSVAYRLAHPNPFDPDYPVEVKTEVSPDGWFPYLEDPTTSPPILEERALLAVWNTGSLEGHYDLRLIYTEDDPDDPTALIHVSDVVTVVIDNTNFTVNPIATNAVDTSYTLDLVIDGGDCHSYTQAATINGHLRVRDLHFWKWVLELQPTTHTHGLQASPRCKTYGSLSDQGPANLPWQLDITQGTKKLDKCGYTLTLWGHDRAIVNSNGAIVHWQKKAVGFSVH